MAGAVPFQFECHRCGHCCSGGNGFVWLQEGEPEAMAAALDMTPEGFRAQHVRTVMHPHTGELRESLREEGGRCSLLEGARHCRAYAARPAHCSTFPYWPGVLASEEGFERARAVCPGIAPVVDEERKRAAFAALEQLYSEVEAFITRADPVCIRRGVCCRFEDAGHELFATGLEADYAAECHPEAPEPEAEGRCPYHVAGRCTARAGRPLGCRTYFCDTRTTSVLEEAHAHFLERLRALEREAGYPASYGRFPALLRARGIGDGSTGPTEA